MVIFKLLYKPFGIVAGIIGGMLSKKLFEWVWSKFDEEEPPKPTTEETNWPKVLGDRYRWRRPPHDRSRPRRRDRAARRCGR